MKKESNLSMRLSEQERVLFQAVADRLPLAYGNVSKAVRILMAGKARDLGIDPESIDPDDLSKKIR